MIVWTVYTLPAGQKPPVKLVSFKTRRAAQRFARRERYLQIIREVKP